MYKYPIPLVGFSVYLFIGTGHLIFIIPERTVFFANVFLVVLVFMSIFPEFNLKEAMAFDLRPVSSKVFDQNV